MFSKLGKGGFDLTVFGDITGQHDAATEIGRKFFDSCFKTFANVGEGKFGALLVAGFGNAIGNRPIRDDARY